MTNIQFHHSYQTLFTRYNLIGFLLIWLLASYILSAFIAGIWEVGNLIMVGSPSYYTNNIFVLPKPELFIYKFFYCSIASAIGFSFALIFLLRSPTGSPAAIRFRKRNAITTSFFSSGYFTFWFLKLAFLLLTLYWTLPLEYDINFLNDFPLMLVLLPLTAFQFGIAGMMRLRMKGKFRLYLTALALFLAISFLNTVALPIDVQQSNRIFANRSIHYRFDLQIPTSDYRVTPDRSTVDIYLVRDSLDLTGPPLLFYETIFNQVQPDSIADIFREDSYQEARYQLSPVFHIDKRIQLKYVKEILERFRNDQVLDVYFSTYSEHSKYPATHPEFYNNGQLYKLPPKYTDLIEYLDSAEILQSRKVPFTIDKKYRDWIGSVEKLNRINVKVAEKNVFVNDQVVSIEQLDLILRTVAYRYAPRYLFIYEPQPEISFGRYITIRDHFFTVINTLRIEKSMGKFDGTIQPYYNPPEVRKLINHYPMNIIEWSTEANRLKNLIKYNQQSE